MTEELKQLREALRRVKHEAASLADAQVIALEALTQRPASLQQGASNEATTQAQGDSSSDAQVDQGRVRDADSRVGSTVPELTQRPAAQSEAQALAHNMMLWREDAVHNGNEYVPVHVRTLEKVIAQLRDMPAPQQATPTQQAAGGPVVLPSFDECNAKKEAGLKLNPLERFVLENDPADPEESAGFSLRLLQAIDFVVATHPAPAVPEVPQEWFSLLAEARSTAYDEEGYIMEPDLASAVEDIDAMLAAAQAKGAGQ